MPLDLHLLLIWLVAYVAAGAFYVLRGLGEAGGRITKCELGGLGLVALCWLPIELGNLVSLQRSHALPTVLARFGIETAPSLTLLIAIGLAAEHLPVA